MREAYVLQISVVIPFQRLFSRGSFVRFVEGLLGSGVALVVLVDDGSGGVYDDLWGCLPDQSRLKILKHAVPCGHGAAIKTGLNYIYCNYPGHIGSIVLHANRKYSSGDVLRLKDALQASPDCFIQGVRKEAPDSRGNWARFADNLFVLLTGAKINYIGLGMRGIPRGFIPRCLEIQSNHYEFDMDLILLCKYNNVLIKEVPVDCTENGWGPAGFNPVWYSMRIGFVLFRFVLVSLISAGIDLILFLVAYAFSSSIALGMIVSRSLAMVVNYRLIKRRVFFAREKDYKILSKYFLTVLFFGSISYFAIKVTVAQFALSVISAKILVESALFLFNLLVQRDVVFISGGRYETTDWDQYYEKPYPSARFTRKIMERKIINSLKRFLAKDPGSLRIVELGGANSCFLDAVLDRIGPGEYRVVDNNEVGLRKLEERLKGRENVLLMNRDIFDLQMKDEMDAAFSVGLIEHFSPEGTRKAIKAHFDAVKPGGVVLMTFPTSTWLYHCARFLSELFGVWIFTDERPLHREEVLDAVALHGQVLYAETIWPVFLTQTIVVTKKNQEGV